MVGLCCIIVKINSFTSSVMTAENLNIFCTKHILKAFTELPSLKGSLAEKNEKKNSTMTDGYYLEEKFTHQSKHASTRSTRVSKHFCVVLAVVAVNYTPPRHGPNSTMQRLNITAILYWEACHSALKCEFSCRTQLPYCQHNKTKRVWWISSWQFKGTVHPSMKIHWTFMHRQAIQGVDEFVSSSEQIWRNVALHHLFTNGSSAVNGCHQNERPNSW